MKALEKKKFYLNLDKDINDEKKEKTLYHKAYSYS